VSYLAERLAGTARRLHELDQDEAGVRACFALSIDVLADGDDPVDRAAAAAYPLLAWPDLPDLSVAVAARVLDLDEEDADIAVGYDWHGGYGHPDHVAVHRVLHRGAELAARRPRLLESTMNRDAMRRFNDAAQCVYKFLWNECCDWYLELIKADMREEGERKEEAQYVLYTVLKEILLLLHPMAPFVTAEVWSSLPGNEGSDIATELYPAERPECRKPLEADQMMFLQEAISAIRTIRAELNIKPSYKLTVVLRPSSEEQAALLEAGRGFFDLARLESLTIDADAHAPKASASNVVRGCEVIVLLDGAVDFQAELARLEKEIGKVDKDLVALNGKLSNENFVKRAPAELVESEKARQADLMDKKAKMQALQIRFKEAMGE
jgi:valyl-tRNA synthetase